jgi:hypothetical protein
VLFWVLAAPLSDCITPLDQCDNRPTTVKLFFWSCLAYEDFGEVRSAVLLRASEQACQLGSNPFSHTTHQLLMQHELPTNNGGSAASNVNRASAGGRAAEEASGRGSHHRPPSSSSERRQQVAAAPSGAAAGAAAAAEAPAGGGPPAAALDSKVLEQLAKGMALYGLQVHKVCMYV